MTLLHILQSKSRISIDQIVAKLEDLGEGSGRQPILKEESKQTSLQREEPKQPAVQREEPKQPPASKQEPKQPDALTEEPKQPAEPIYEIAPDPFVKAEPSSVKPPEKEYETIMRFAQIELGGILKKKF